MDLEEIILRLQTSFQNADVKQQVLDTAWLEQNMQSRIHSTGFCSSASEVIYRLTGGKDRWYIKSINDPRNWGNGTHFFLEDKENGNILDVTSSQYTERNIEIPYELGIARGLRRTSNAAKNLARLSNLGEI